jgi:hypothetical protein
MKWSYSMKDVVGPYVRTAASVILYCNKDGWSQPWYFHSLRATQMLD